MISPSRLARASVEGPRDSLPALVDGLAVRLLMLGAGSDSARLTLQPVVSVAAMRAFVDGRNAYENGQTEQASDLLQQATLLDSSFALAAFEVMRAGRGGEDRDRARRLAFGRTRSACPCRSGSPRHLDRPASPGPQSIDRWQDAAGAFPDRADMWYNLGDVYYHDGLLAGVTDPFRYANEAFQRGWTIDSGRVACARRS
jgi:hypothetical protein